MRRGIRHVCAVAFVACAALVIATPVASASQTSQVKHGGAVTVVMVNSTWPSLDPAVDTGVPLNVQYFDAIYGQLFTQPPVGKSGAISNTSGVLPDLATSWTESTNHLTITVQLRHGVTFQDGTPFNSAAVVYNIDRDLEPQFGCTCAQNLGSLKSVNEDGKYAFVIHLSKPDATILEGFVAYAPDYIASPTALASESEAAFGQHPVGAGPFEVVSNEASAQLVLQRFPHYWQKGHPYLSSLTFITTPADQSAFAALQAGTAQIEFGLSTVSLIQQAKADPSQFGVSQIGGMQANGFYFNELKPPFNNILAREALSYAINPKAILAAASPGFGETWESPGGPGGLFSERTVPGYQNYNLAKAKALVQQLGGLTFNYLTTNSPANLQLAEALQNEWEAAGMTVNLQSVTATQDIVDLENGTWQAGAVGAGAYDPDLDAGGLPNRFGTGGPYSGINDPVLDGMINQSEQFLSNATRQKIFDKIWAYLVKEDDVHVVYVAPLVNIHSSDLTGITLTPYGTSLTLQVVWQNVAYK